MRPAQNKSPSSPMIPSDNRSLTEKRVVERATISAQIPSMIGIPGQKKGQKNTSRKTGYIRARTIWTHNKPEISHIPCIMEMP
jgi:hypothetical protein